MLHRIGRRLTGDFYFSFNTVNFIRLYLNNDFLNRKKQVQIQRSNSVMKANSISMNMRKGALLHLIRDLQARFYLWVRQKG